MRKIRNECRYYMTHDTHKITKAEQMKWFNETYLPAHGKGCWYAFLGFNEAAGYPVAFGLIRFKDDKFWLTGGVYEAYRGMGYGRDMFEYLTKFTTTMFGEAWLDVFKTNTKALALYKSLGYSIIDEDERVYIMKK